MDAIDTHTRIPADLHAELAAHAKRLGLSLNAMIVLALRYGVVMVEVRLGDPHE
jgi:predicted HicB family RNase H-like nuclease